MKVDKVIDVIEINLPKVVGVALHALQGCETDVRLMLTLKDAKKLRKLLKESE